jgi:hypothetical protein
VPDTKANHSAHAVQTERISGHGDDAGDDHRRFDHGGGGRKLPLHRLRQAI